MNNVMSISKYCYGEIKKVINNNIYQIGYINIKVEPMFDGKPDKKIINNNNWCTNYCLYKNNELISGTFDKNLTKEELLKRFDELINILENE